MKFSQIVPEYSPRAQAYVREIELGIAKEVTETKDRILGYLFGLNAGGLVAAGAFLSQKAPNCQIIAATILFGLGLLAAVLRSAKDYYGCEAVAKAIRQDVRDLYDDKLEWEQFLERRKVVIPEWSYHVLGWGAVILFFLGLVLGFWGAAR
jgi:hypothetical protein